MDRKYLPTLLALLSLLFSSLVQAIGLGEAKVRSHLGQPLLVEIPLSGATVGSIAQTRVRIGGEADFKRLALIYDHSVASLQVRTVERAGQWLVEIRSQRPFRQPVVEFPLALQGRGTRLVRGFTLLLDPPNYRRIASPALTRPEPAGESQYRVARGETLWPIAKRLKPAGVTTNQMMLALLRENPHAFIDGNINRLRADVVLQIPASKVLQQDRPGRARSEVNRQMAEWHKPPQAAGNQSVTPAAAAQPVPAEDAPQDNLRVLPGEADEQVEPQEALRRQVLLTHEEVEKSRLEQQQMRQQIERLQEELAHMQRLMALKDEQIAALQVIASKQQAARATATVPETVTAPEPPPAATPAPQAEAQPATTPIAQNLPAAIPQQPAAQPLPWKWIATGAVVALVLVLLTLYQYRRRKTPVADMRLTDLPVIQNAPPPPYTRTPPAEPAYAPQQPAAPPAEPSQQTVARQPSNSLLDEPLSSLSSLPGENEMPPPTEAGAAPDTSGMETDEVPMSEDELAELAEQLTVDIDQELAPPSDIEPPSKSIDEFWSPRWDSPAPATPQASSEDTAVLEEDLELDMARAYLELGDREAAIDMLETTFDSTDDPERRSRIQSLLDKAG